MAQRAVEPAATRWHVFANVDALRDAAVVRILDAANQAIAARGAFHLVLAGGTTPRAVYQTLCIAPAQWEKWHIWLGDERCLPPRDAERNSRMAYTAWLDHVAIPAQQIHPIPAELGPQEAAHRYASELAGVADFDLVLLGLGEDGHTASLFPGHDWGCLANAPVALAVVDAPKPPSQRVSLSAWRLGSAHSVLFLVSGVGKREAVARWRRGENLPAAAISCPGRVDVLVEQVCLDNDGATETRIPPA